jgi:rSAM/selenodomain-associated transferase 2
MDRVSIVIPALNEAGAISATLRALATARARGAEVIVVDGGSQDGTTEIAASAADHVIIAEPGRANQMNAGVRSASGEILLFMHADSIAPRDVDLLLVQAVGGAQLAWGRFDVHIESDVRMLRLVAALMNMRSRITGIATGDQGIFTTRPLFEALGGFPRQPLMEDIAFSRSAKRLAAPICLRDRMHTSGRRWERHGVFRTILLMWKLRLAYFLGTDPRDLALRYDQTR